MPAQIRSSYRPILLACQTQLVTITGLPTSRVLIRARRQGASKHPIQAAQHLVLYSSSPAPLPDWTGAAGRHNKGLQRILEVEIWTRLGLDQIDRDDNFLLNEDEGHYILEEAVLDALDLFAPTNKRGDLLVAYPIRYVPGEEPSKEEPVDPQWGHSSFKFSIPYVADLTQTRQ